MNTLSHTPQRAFPHFQDWLNGKKTVLISEKTALISEPFCFRKTKMLSLLLQLPISCRYSKSALHFIFIVTRGAYPMGNVGSIELQTNVFPSTEVSWASVLCTLPKSINKESAINLIPYSAVEIKKPEQVITHTHTRAQLHTFTHVHTHMHIQQEKKVLSHADTQETAADWSFFFFYSSLDVACT